MKTIVSTQYESTYKKKLILVQYCTCIYKHSVWNTCTCTCTIIL